MTKRPRQFDNPEIGPLLDVVLSLIGEVYVMRDRMRIIEKMLEARGTISLADIEAFKPTPEEEEQIRGDRDLFMARLFRALEGDLD
jgi:hypothetical protein